MQAQGSIAVRASQLHPPLGEPNPKIFEKALFYLLDWEVFLFENTAICYITAFLLELEVTSLSLLEQMLCRSNPVLIVFLKLLSVSIPVGTLGNRGLQTWAAFCIQLTRGLKPREIQNLIHNHYPFGSGIETLSTSSCIWAQTNDGPEYLPCVFY